MQDRQDRLAAYLHSKLSLSSPTTCDEEAHAHVCQANLTNAVQQQQCSPQAARSCIARHTGGDQLSQHEALHFA